MEDHQIEDTNQIIDNKFLTFKVGNELYGMQIEHVIEIIEILKITPMPESEPYIKGVINLRGRVIPVMDIRLRFGMPEREHDAKTCIIVVKVAETMMGIIVDTVSEVVDINNDNIETPPSLNESDRHNFVKEMGKIGDDVYMLLDLTNLMSSASIEVDSETQLEDIA